MTTQKTNAAILDELARELNRVLEKVHVDLDRVAILTGALAGFSRPVPDYEPTFRHWHRRALREHELH